MFFRMQFLHAMVYLTVDRYERIDPEMNSSVYAFDHQKTHLDN